jgi:hypothetical protein
MGDTFIRIGDIIARRVEGLSMGGSLSPVITCCDIDASVDTLLKDPRRQQRSGWTIRHKKIEQVVAGILHVDDCLLLSFGKCPQCLIQGFRTVVPHRRMQI